MKKYWVYGLIISLLLGGLANACKKSVEEDASPPSHTKGLDLSDRIEGLSKQINSKPNDYSLYQDRAKLYFEDGQGEAALQDIQSALSLFDTSPELHYLLGFYSFSLRDTSTAKTSLAKAIALGSSDPQVFYLLGQLHFFQGNYPEARKHYLAAVDRDKENPLFPFALGLLEEGEGNLNKALANYQNSLSIDSTFDKTLVRLHDLALNHNKNEQLAKQYIDQLIRIDPGHAAARFREGNHYMRQALMTHPERKPDMYKSLLNEAVASYTLSIRKDKGQVQCLYNRGFCYFLAGNYDPAIEDFEGTLSLDSLHVQAHFMLGSLYEGFDDTEKALQYYSRALALDPSFAEARQAVNELTPQ